MQLPPKCGFLLYGLMYALLASNAWPSSVIQQPIAVLANTANLIFEGKVTQINTEADGKNIYTWVSFDILDIIAGEYPDTQIRLRYLGGSADGVSLKVGDMHLPTFGEEGIYFVESLQQQTVHPLRGWGQGHFIIQSEVGSGKRMVLNSQRHAVVAVDVDTKGKSSKLDASTAAGITLASDENDLQTSVSSQQFKALLRRARQP